MNSKSNAQSIFALKPFRMSNWDEQFSLFKTSCAQTAEVDKIFVAIDALFHVSVTLVVLFIVYTQISKCIIKRLGEWFARVLCFAEACLMHQWICLHVTKAEFFFLSFCELMILFLVLSTIAFFDGTAVAVFVCCRH